MLVKWKDAILFSCSSVRCVSGEPISKTYRG